ncbi:methyl-accepting chemotaxis protein, partial [Cronobacter sakazakii]
GRGFAVVAAEVRALAQRSSSAAQDIRNLIDRSVSRIDEGNSLVKGAGSAMEEIL